MESTTGATTEDRIRAAYASLQGDGYIQLATIRQMVDAPRAEVDEALRAMYRLSDVNIVNDADQLRLTAAQRAAAVEIGGQDKHLIQIVQEQAGEGWW
jgi:hypothetical protein